MFTNGDIYRFQTDPLSEPLTSLCLSCGVLEYLQAIAMPSQSEPGYLGGLLYLAMSSAMDSDVFSKRTRLFGVKERTRLFGVKVGASLSATSRQFIVSLRMLSASSRLL